MSEQDGKVSSPPVNDGTPSSADKERVGHARGCRQHSRSFGIVTDAELEKGIEDAVEKSSAPSLTKRSSSANPQTEETKADGKSDELPAQVDEPRAKGDEKGDEEGKRDRGKEKREPGPLSGTNRLSQTSGASLDNVVNEEAVVPPKGTTRYVTKISQATPC